MSELIAVTYPDINQAAKVLDELKRMVTERLLDLDDAVYVTKDATGEVDLHQMINLPALGAARGGTTGALWGTLIGLLFLQPVMGAVVGAAFGAGAGALAGKASDYGIDDNFVRQLSTQMTPNSSAILVLVRRVTADKVVPRISTFGGTVLHTSLSTEAEQRLQMALAQQAGVIPQSVTATGMTSQGSQATGQ